MRSRAIITVDMAGTWGMNLEQELCLKDLISRLFAVHIDDVSITWEYKGDDGEVVE